MLAGLLREGSEGGTAGRPGNEVLLLLSFGAEVALVELVVEAIKLVSFEVMRSCCWYKRIAVMQVKMERRIFIKTRAATL